MSLSVEGVFKLTQHKQHYSLWTAQMCSIRGQDHSTNPRFVSQPLMDLVWLDVDKVALFWPRIPGQKRLQFLWTAQDDLVRAQSPIFGVNDAPKVWSFDGLQANHESRGWMKRLESFRPYA
jgi:hypothetical protein